jgi:hypothetical protein
MGVTIELQNLGDAGLCREITTHLEHAFSDRQGEWRVSIVGSGASENWEMRIEGPSGFERYYSLSGAAGEHEPATIRTLVIGLMAAYASLKRPLPVSTYAPSRFSLECLHMKGALWQRRRLIL